MDLSNLQPALGSKHSDNFRRGRREVSNVLIPRLSLESMYLLLKYSTTMQ